MRVTAMLVILVLLCIAIGPTANFAWLFEIQQWKVSVHPSSPAVCFYKLGVDTSVAALEFMVVTVALLVYGYGIRIAKMSPRFGKLLRGRGSILEKRTADTRARWEPKLRDRERPCKKP